MARTSLVTYAACALLAVAVQARAQDQDQHQDPPNRFLHPSEVSLFVTSGGDGTGIGMAVRWPMASRLSIQAEGEYRMARLALRSLPSSTGINGNLVFVLDLPRLGRVTPFVVGGGGIERNLALEGAPTGSRWRAGNSFVVNGGGGLRVALFDRVSARVELRYADGWAQGARDSLRLMYGTTVGLGER